MPANSWVEVVKKTCFFFIKKGLWKKGKPNLDEKEVRFILFFARTTCDNDNLAVYYEMPFRGILYHKNCTYNSFHSILVFDLLTFLNSFLKDPQIAWIFLSIKFFRLYRFPLYTILSFCCKLSTFKFRFVYALLPNFQRLEWLRYKSMKLHVKSLLQYLVYIFRKYNKYLF